MVKNLLTSLIMKLFFLLIFLSVVQSSVYGQLTIDEFYEDKSKKLVQSRVETFDSLGVSELKKRFKNWGSTQFVNLREITVSETDDQIVLNYITDSFYYTVFTKSTLSWYVRMVVQFKEDRIRVLMYDDGNVFRGGSVVSGVRISSVPDRSTTFLDYFNSKGKPTMGSGGGLENFKKSINLTVDGLVKSIRDNSGGTDTDTDW